VALGGEGDMDGTAVLLAGEAAHAGHGRRRFDVDARAVRLADVTAAWTSGERVVIVP